MCKKYVFHLFNKIKKVRRKKNPLLQDGIKNHDFTEGVG